MALEEWKPTYEKLMLPFLQVLSDGKEHQGKEIVAELAKTFNLTDVELSETTRSGARRFEDRVSWARTYLKHAKLIDSPKKASFVITDRGYTTLKDDPTNISQYLRQYPEYLEFVSTNKKSNTEKEFLNIENAETPDEIIANAQQLYFGNLQNELLSKLKTVDPVRFEEIVLKLMEKMNYGVGQMTKTSHDGGIDGIIDEDELGLEKIYLQVKRYATNKVNEKEVQNFAGALGCSTVNKGVFITTSFFDERAKKKATNVQGKIIRLIDGEELTKLMIKHNVGVQVKTKIEIKK